MSASPEKRLRAGQGRLEIETRAGVSVRVLDGGGAEIASATGNVTLTLPQGVYEVQWMSAGVRSETLVRVLADAKPAKAYFEPPAEFATRGADEIAPNPAFDAATLMKQAAPEPLSDEDHGSAIVVIVTGDRGSKPLSPMRLYNERDIAMRADREAEPGLAIGQDEVTRFYSVPPGSYLLSFGSVTGETMQQTLPALPGRRTFVFCAGLDADVLVAEGEGFKRVEGSGIDPAQTVIVSAAGDEADDRIRERVRLARVLLHDIASGGTSLDDALMAILEDPSTDPLLRLYGAAVVVGRLCRQEAHVAGQRWPSRDVALFRDEASRRALSWLRRDHGRSPDETVLRWKLSDLRNDDRRIRGRQSIANPPMLAQAWRWAVEASMTDEKAIEATPSNIAATRSASGGEPWLCWKASAAKAAPVMFSEQTPPLDTLAKMVSAQARDIVDVGTEAVFSKLTPEAGVAALNLAQEGAPSRANLADMAVALGLPAPALARRLMRTKLEFDTIAAGDTPERRSSDGPKALSLAITVPDDPQKGRFGGQAECDGFTLSAQFATTKFKGWTRITLSITGPAREGEPAKFYLHDSFYPPIQDAAFTRGRASVQVTSWGGFTVGGWLPERSLELELDLATIEGAPEPIRTR